MNCRTCRHVFDENKHRPVQLSPCNHSVCLFCIKSCKRSLSCCDQTDVFDWKAKNKGKFKPNYDLLPLVAEANSTRSGLRL